MHLGQKKLAARVLKCGISRVRILDEKSVEEALTRDDIRSLVKKGAIVKMPKVGNSRAHANKILRQKKKGRRIGRGSRKGTKKTTARKKDVWMRTVRPIRRLLKELRETNRIDKDDYRELYLKIKGGYFRNKRHIKLFIQEHKMVAGVVSTSPSEKQIASPIVSATSAGSTQSSARKKKASAAKNKDNEQHNPEDEETQ